MLHALLQVVWTEMLLAVCVRNHHIMIQIHLMFFLSKIFTPFSKRATCLCDCQVRDGVEDSNAEIRFFNNKVKQKNINHPEGEKQAGR